MACACRSTAEKVRITLTCARLNHPGGVLGYRIDYAGHSLVYATDTEHWLPDPKLVKLAEGADLLIYDSQYDDDGTPVSPAHRAPAGDLDV